MDTHHTFVHTKHCVYSENATNFHLLGFPKLYLMLSFTINDIIYRLLKIYGKMYKMYMHKGLHIIEKFVHHGFRYQQENLQ